MSRILPRLYGLCAALYLLSGRWTLGRLADREPGELALGAAVGYEREASPFYAEPRFWLVFALASSILVFRGPSRAAKALTLPLISFFGYILLSWFWTPDYGLAAEKAYEVGLVTVATLALIHIYSQVGGEDAFSWTLGGLFLAGAMFGAIALVMVAVGISGGRVAVLGGGPNVFARTMGMLVLISLYWSRRPVLTAVMLPVACIGGILVILSGSRGGLLALAIALSLYATLEARNLKRLAVTGAIAAGIVVIVLTSTPIGPAAVGSFHDRVERLLIEDHYTSGRDELYESAASLGVAHPLFGAGLSAFPTMGYGSYPHNLFLELFCEQGTLGLFLFVCAMASTWIGRCRRGGWHPVALTGGLLFLVAGQFSGDFYDCRAVYLFAVAAACVSGRSRVPGTVDLAAE